MINFNKTVLNVEIQDFINDNINFDVSKLALKGIPFSDELKRDIITQIETKQRCIKKLPTWFNTKEIYYPTKLNIEQTSSEVTAKYKASLVSGDNLIDITGGFGVDSFYFSKKIKQVKHSELDSNLSKIAKHNAKLLKTNNIEFYPEDGIKVLQKTNVFFDWIYIDPSRRDDIKGKVFLLKDCLPNVTSLLDIFFEKSKNILVKTSPLIDLKSGINELQNVKSIHCIAVNNEVKELLWVLKSGFEGEIEVKTINFKNETQQIFDFYLNKEKNKETEYSLPLTYLFEPNAAILKSGAFNSIAYNLNVPKLNKHTHLYTSDAVIDFPGRKFKIEKIIPYSKKDYNKTIALKQANVTTRNFTESVAQIRNKFKIKDGGKNYLFFTTNLKNSKIIILCSKI
ncbi:class I SAM-dependent methyltransferase [Olleya sp. R77988]|uniref:THUMP-like domain-containing protein n=1 Tax=Olleya sp. R77988 TaxID=3093875 RepID=UPI0037CC6AD6